MTTIFVTIGIVLSFVCGFCLSQILKPKVAGVLKAKYDDEGTYLFLELNRPVNDIEKENYITLKVDLSQK